MKRLWLIGLLGAVACSNPAGPDRVEAVHYLKPPKAPTCEVACGDIDPCLADGIIFAGPGNIDTGHPYYIAEFTRAGQIYTNVAACGIPLIKVNSTPYPPIQQLGALITFQCQAKSYFPNVTATATGVSAAEATEDNLTRTANLFIPLCTP